MRLILSGELILICEVGLLVDEVGKILLWVGTCTLVEPVCAVVGYSATVVRLFGGLEMITSVSLSSL